MSGEKIGYKKIYFGQQKFMYIVKYIFLLIIIINISICLNANNIYGNNNTKGSIILINQPDKSIVKQFLNGQNNVECINMWCSADSKSGKSYVTASDGFGYSAIFMANIFDSGKILFRISVFSDESLFNELPDSSFGTAKIYKDRIPIRFKSSVKRTQSNINIYNFDLIFNNQGFEQFIKEISKSNDLISFDLLDRKLLLQFSLDGFNQIVQFN